MEPLQLDLVRVGAATTVPLRRLGALLHDTRTARGIALEALAESSNDAFSAADLADIEGGIAELTDDDVDQLLALYDAEPGDLLASRSKLVIDLHEGTVAAGPWSTTFRPGSDDTDDVLAQYLALVYEMRNLEPGSPVSLRTLDVSVLSSALAMPADAIEGRLVVLMEPGNKRVERFRALLRTKLLVPAAGVVLAVTAVGVLVWVSSSEAGEDLVVTSPPQEAPPGADIAEIGEGLTIERTDTIDQGGEIAPPGADIAEIGEGLTIERTDTVEP